MRSRVAGVFLRNSHEKAMIHEKDRNREDYSATYCPEDDKLRLYCGRVERSTYDHLRENGFQASPKQDCDFVAVWTVRREDIVLEMIHDADDIGDEDYSPQERAADRQERFEGYRDKRASEAGSLADRYEGGDDAYGNQNRGRAERMAARRDRIGAKWVAIVEGRDVSYFDDDGTAYTASPNGLMVHAAVAR